MLPLAFQSSPRFARRPPARRLPRSRIWTRGFRHHHGRHHGRHHRRNCSLLRVTYRILTVTLSWVVREMVMEDAASLYVSSRAFELHALKLVFINTFCRLPLFIYSIRSSSMDSARSLQPTSFYPPVSAKQTNATQSANHFCRGHLST